MSVDQRHQNKTNKLTADTVKNYAEALEKHTKDDKKITNERVKSIERDMNQHLGQFNRMLRAGVT